MRDVLKTAGCALWTAPDLQRGWILIERHAPWLVIAEADFGSGTWKEVLHTIHSLRNPPLLMVSSRLADHHLWSEVLHLGGHDVLVKPFDRDEVMRIVRLARAKISFENAASGEQLLYRTAAGC
jgi:DNA-binding response OmpR family regulator